MCENLNLNTLITGYPPDLANLSVIDIGKGCGYEYQIYDYGPGPGAFNNIPANGTPFVRVHGIDVFYALINHELEHWVLLEEFWSDTGYDSANDCDEDFYPDDWEAGPIGMDYGFIVGVDDQYTGNYDPANLPATIPVPFRAATQYQEERCRRREMATNVNSPHAGDWSFDPTYEHQGKNW